MRCGEAHPDHGLDGLPVPCCGHRQFRGVTGAETLGNVDAFLNFSSLEVH